MLKGSKKISAFAKKRLHILSQTLPREGGDWGSNRKTILHIQMLSITLRISITLLFEAFCFCLVLPGNKANVFFTNIFSLRNWPSQLSSDETHYKQSSDI